MTPADRSQPDSSPRSIFGAIGFAPGNRFIQRGADSVVICVWGDDDDDRISFHGSIPIGEAVITRA